MCCKAQVRGQHFSDGYKYFTHSATTDMFAHIPQLQTAVMYQLTADALYCDVIDIAQHGSVMMALPL